MNKQNQLAAIHNSGQPYIIYKSQKGFDLYTNFSKKIILNNKNVSNFLNQRYKSKSKNTDLFIGFFGYELLNNLINIKMPNQKNINFPKGIFYKPEKKINLGGNLKYKSENFFKNSNFKININKNSYTKIFSKFKKKIKSGETYQIKICTKYKKRSKINPLDFFCRLSMSNLAPEAFMIKDHDYSIISCSPENLITKHGFLITTKPIAGTVKKIKGMNKTKALNYFKKNIKETKEHNMIVDMERNDLSKVCQVGSVKLSKQKIVEEYKDLFHYVSLIKGKLKKNIAMPCNVHYYHTGFLGFASLKKYGCVKDQRWSSKKNSGGSSANTYRNYRDLEECRDDLIKGSDITSPPRAVTFKDGKCTVWNTYN